MTFKVFLVRAITFVSGLYFLLEFLLPKKIPLGAGQDPLFFGAYHEQISNGFSAVAACAAGLGVLNLFLHHGKRILWKDAGYFFSATLLLMLALTLFVLTKDWLTTLRAGEQVSYFSMLQEYAAVVEVASPTDQPVKLEVIKRATSAKLQENHFDDATLKDKGIELQKDFEIVPFAASNVKPALQEYGQLYRAAAEKERTQTFNAKISRVLVDGLFTALGSAMFSLLGFYIAAAAYRAFRVKSFESGLLMLTATIVMLGQITFGSMIWEGFPGLRLWLLQVPSSAAARAIEIGASIAGLILAFRMWLSIESSSFRSRK